MEVEDRIEHIEAVATGGHSDEQIHLPPAAAGREEHFGPSPADYISGDDKNRSGLSVPLGRGVHLPHDRH